MNKIVAVFNQKGGVGKTTTALNLTTALSLKGYRILTVDIDPQGNAGSGFGLDKTDMKQSVYDALIGEADPKNVILTTGYENLHILPSNVDLAGSEVEMASMPGREKKLKNCLDQVRGYYDYIFIDCPPSLGLLTINALTAADSVLIPIQCEFYALEGVSQLMSTIELVKNSLNPTLEIEGVLLTMFDSRTNLSGEVMQEVREYFKDKVYHTMIPRNVRLAEAPSFGKTIFDYSFNSKGSKAYQEFADEFEKIIYVCILITGLSRALLSTRHPSWRLPAICSSVRTCTESCAASGSIKSLACHSSNCAWASFQALVSLMGVDGLTRLLCQRVNCTCSCISSG